MGKTKMFGDTPTSPLKSEPRNVLPDSGKGFNCQTVGTTVPLQSEPSTVKYGANTPNGTFQSFGETVPLKHTPISGWQSYDTPMSERTGQSKKSY